MALMRRLASLVPPPENHDTCYFGVFAPNAKRRSRLVRGPKKECPTHSGCEEREPPVATLYAPLDPLDGGEAEQEAYIPWAALLRRVYHVDMLACPCGEDPRRAREARALERSTAAGEGAPDAAGGVLRAPERRRRRRPAAAQLRGVGQGTPGQPLEQESSQGAGCSPRRQGSTPLAGSWGAGGVPGLVRSSRTPTSPR